MTGISPSSADERVPPCPHFRDCGACQLQHLHDDTYRAQKEAAVKSMMEENGIRPATYLPSVFIPAGTRRRVTFSAIKDGDDMTIGFHRYHSHDIAPVTDCLLLTPALRKIYGMLPAALLPVLPRGVQVDIMLQQCDTGAVDCLITGLKPREEARLDAKQTAGIAAMAQQCGFHRVSFCETEHSSPVVQVEFEKLTKTSGALKVEISAGAFLQPSEEGEVALSGAVITALGKRSRKDKVLDLFSGCGTFAGRVLDICQVHAVEGDAGMASSLKQAAKGNARFTAEARDLFKEPLTTREMKGVAAAIFDPPRAGAKEQCQKLAKSDIPLIVAVSCSPATFARDAKILMGGGYKLETLQIVDQFIYTTHTELVGLFTRG